MEVQNSTMQNVPLSLLKIDVISSLKIEHSAFYDNN